MYGFHTPGSGRLFFNILHDMTKIYEMLATVKEQCGCFRFDSEITEEHSLYSLNIEEDITEDIHAASEDRQSD